MRPSTAGDAPVPATLHKVSSDHEARVDRAVVLELLNSVKDPCSVTAGCPAGLVEMGLVRDVRLTTVSGGTAVEVTLAITEPGCLMAAPFTVQATELVSSLSGVVDARVRVDPALPWEERDMDAAYRDRLDSHRAQQRRHLAIISVQ